MTSLFEPGERDENPNPDLRLIDGGKPSGEQDREVPPIGGRTGQVDKLLKEWRDSLMDVSGRNRLLYYRDSKVGTLDVSHYIEAILQAFGRDQPITISSVFPDEEDCVKASKSLKQTAKKSQLAAEELGRPIAKLAYGFVSWENPNTSSGTSGVKARPNAPVLLFPISIVPKGGSSGGFKFSSIGEPDLNPVLKSYLQGEFGVDIGADALLALSENDISRFLELFAEQMTKTLPGSSLQMRAVIGAFTYHGQSVVDDLSAENAEFFAASDLVAAFAGDPEAATNVRSAGLEVSLNAPDFVSPSDEFLVLDADASQNYAINAVLAGQNLVIQGPPGTGKSQTITNLIGELSARNKSVLFVAQKRAAIEAVLGRLDGVGLSHLYLDLFQLGGSRRKIMDDIGNALEARRRADKPRVEALHEELRYSRDRLVAYNEAMHEKRDPWGLPLVASTRREDCFAGFASKQKDRNRPVSLSIDDLQRWNRSAHLDLRREVEELFDNGVFASGANEKKGWSRTKLESKEQVTAAKQLGRELLHGKITELKKLLEGMLNETELTVGFDEMEIGDAVVLANLLERHKRLYNKAPFLFDPDQMDSDLMKRRLFATGGRAFRREQKSECNWRERWRTRREMRKALGGHRSAAYLHKLLLDWRAIREEMEPFFSSGPRDEEEVISRGLPEKPFSNVAELRKVVEALRSGFEVMSAKYLQGVDLQVASLGEAEEFLSQLVRDSKCDSYPKYLEMLKHLGEFGATPVLDSLFGGAASSTEEARDLFDAAFASSVMEHVLATDDRISGVSRLDRERWVKQFSASDAEQKTVNVARILRAVAERATEVLNQHADEERLVQKQVKAKRRHKSVREMCKLAPHVILAAKPVWVMSPLNVAEVLPAEKLFDVVIFDEASQVMPAAAMSAIARGEQLVVAGDSLQLPPTTFFYKGMDSVEEENDEDEVGEGSYRPEPVARDLESILELAELTLGRERSRYLAWHYRSEDEKLIATSNRYVYRPKHRHMTTFPSSSAEGALTHCPVEPSKGLGSTNKSPVNEVNKVVELVKGHAKAKPEASLGVIAFGTKHAERIEDALSRAAAEDPDLEEFLRPQDREPFFVKSIEQVQGDERDVIFLTLGYSRNESGKLSYNWGPVNTEGGHRRVNVAISRAKRQMKLVTSFRAREIDDKASSAEGFELMRRFITFAGSEGSDFGDEGSSGVPLNPFEGSILERLQEAGMKVETQWGVGKYRLDFAVRNPDNPGEFVLAIEADGASYHSGHNARERDRLRQEQLERRGWRFVRIWSADWFKDADAEMERVVAEYKDSISCAKGQPSPLLQDEVAALPSQDSGPLAAPERSKRPPVKRGLPGSQYGEADLRKIVRWICSDNQTRTHSELEEEVLEDLRPTRRTTKLRNNIRAAIRAVNW